MTKELIIYPYPRSLQWLDGASLWSSRLLVHPNGAEAESLVVTMQVEQRCAAAIANSRASAPSSSTTNIRVDYDAGLHAQGYVLQWDSEGLLLSFSTEAGLHYALVTLEQMLKRNGLEWAHFRIEDEPDFPVRGVMLDIGRNKIPRMETLFPLIDRLSELKINHLQLYMEGFCFDYEQYRASFTDETPMSAAEFRELVAYARSKYIDLVPNQNCLGHMAHWLAKPEFSELAEHPGGIPTPIGFTLPATTLDPTDERSHQLVKNLFDELLPHFTSEFANINLDEPFGLGKGRSKQRADEIGVGKLYMEYAESMVEIIRSHGKKTLMWGDIIIKHPELIGTLPDDVTVLDWNYDDHTSFEEHCKVLQAHAIPFYVCPGTSSWASISGRTDNMLNNIADAARQGKTYGASGLVVTDWGDSGHWQVMAVSYPGYAYAAGASWQVDANVNRLDGLERYLNDCVFQDKSGSIGQLLLELGRYYHLENSTLENMTYTNYLLNRGVSTAEKLEQETQMMVKVLVEIGGRGIPFQLTYQYDDMLDWLAGCKSQLKQTVLEIPDAATVVDELSNTIRLVELGAGLHRYIHRIKLEDTASEIAWLEHSTEQLELAIAEFKRLWLLRNREGGLETSLRNLYKLQTQYKEKLNELKSL